MFYFIVDILLLGSMLRRIDIFLFSVGVNVFIYWDTKGLKSLMGPNNYFSIVVNYFDFFVNSYKLDYLTFWVLSPSILTCEYGDSWLLIL